MSVANHHSAVAISGQVCATHRTPPWLLVGMLLSHPQRMMALECCGFVWLGVCIAVSLLVTELGMHSRISSDFAESKREIGRGLQPCDIDSPSNYYFAPSESVPPNVPAHSQRMAVFHTEVAHRRLHATASWLFHFFHDEPVVMRMVDGRMRAVCPPYGLSAVAPLRTSCRQWASLLPYLHCCECGGDFWIGYFRGWWGFTRQGNHGPVPCEQCYNICTYHLSCFRCERRAAGKLRWLY